MVIFPRGSTLQASLESNNSVSHSSSRCNSLDHSTCVYSIYFMDDVLDNLNDFTANTSCANANPQVGMIIHMAGSVSSRTSKRLLQVEIVGGILAEYSVQTIPRLILPTCEVSFGGRHHLSAVNNVLVEAICSNAFHHYL